MNSRCSKIVYQIKLSLEFETDKTILIPVFLCYIRITFLKGLQFELQSLCEVMKHNVDLSSLTQKLGSLSYCLLHDLYKKTISIINKL